MATQTSVGRDANSRPYHARDQECVHTRERVRARMPTCAHSYIFLGLELVIISHLQVSFFREGMVQPRISEDVPNWRPFIWQFAIDQDL